MSFIYLVTARVRSSIHLDRTNKIVPPFCVVMLYVYILNTKDVYSIKHWIVTQVTIYLLCKLDLVLFLSKGLYSPSNVFFTLETFPWPPWSVQIKFLQLWFVLNIIQFLKNQIVLRYSYPKYNSIFTSLEAIDGEK